MRKLWYIYIIKYYSAIKKLIFFKIKIMKFVGKSMNLGKKLILSELFHTQKDNMVYVDIIYQVNDNPDAVCRTTEENHRVSHPGGSFGIENRINSYGWMGGWNRRLKWKGG